ncbi:MAG: hypothetical protein WBC65_07770 [Ignavibacteria bacterium]
MKQGDKLKILFLGHCSYYHVQNIASLLKDNLDYLHIAGANMIRPDGKEVTDVELGSFDEFVKLPRKRTIEVSPPEIAKEFMRSLSDKISRSIIIRDILNLRISHAKRYLSAIAEEKKFSSMMKKSFNNYDVFHFHYLGAEMLVPLKYIGKNKIVILHVWGSDLLNDAGVESYKAQYEAIQRADFVIINTIEMTQYFLAKFGREFISKIRNAYFVIDNEMMDRIANADSEMLRKKFVERYGIEESKIIIEAGYNASIWQKHLEIIEQLNLLPEELKAKIHVVIPMTYGLSDKSGKYLSNVKRAAEDSTFSSTVIDSYITTDEVLELIVSTEIKLNLRETDNLNTAMLESYCSDTIAVNGAWMPYGALRRIGIYYREIESIKHLKNEMEFLLKNLKIERAKTADNRKIVRDFFDNSRVASDWVNLYEEINKRANEKRIANETA